MPSIHAELEKKIPRSLTAEENRIKCDETYLYVRVCKYVFTMFRLIKTDVGLQKECRQDGYYGEKSLETVVNINLYNYK